MAPQDTMMSKWAGQSSLAGGWMFVGTQMFTVAGAGTPAQYSAAIGAGLAANSSAKAQASSK